MSISTFAILLSVRLAFASDSYNELEMYIRNNYLRSDPTYLNIPINKYRNMRNIDTHKYKSIRKTPGVASEIASFINGIHIIYYKYQEGLRVDKYNPPQAQMNPKVIKIKEKVASTSKLNAKDIIIDEIIRTKQWDYVFFTINSMDIQSSELTEEMYFQKKRDFFNGFCLLRETRIVCQPVELSKEDKEVGGYSRTLWDEFKMNGREYVLVFNRIYEKHVFEVYAIQDSGLSLELTIEFGGL
ncbi:MAG: hypothetical protein HQK85_07785 [Nitrospinae bacterium]|nr:hypothetical protein [Nitrospinota bacterium]